MRTYETIFVLNPELGTDAVAEQIEFYKDNITKNGGEIVSLEQWGKLTLAYKIENFSEGIYVLIQFNAEMDYLPELERRYKYYELVLRHVIVMIDGKKFKLKPRKDPVRRERKGGRRQDGDMEQFESDMEQSEADIEQIDEMTDDVEAATEEDN